MDINGMLIWAVVLVSLIVFIIILVKSYKSWGLLHTIVLSILFIEAWTFILLAGSVSHDRMAYLKAIDRQTKRVNDLTAEVDLAMFGSRIDPKLDLEKFVPLTNELNRITLERGRVWRSARRQNVTPTSATVELPATVSNLPVAAPPAAANAAAANAAVPPTSVADGLTVDSVVYLFGETPSPRGMLPSVYLGEYIVTESKDRVVTFRPSTTLSPMQLGALQSPTFESWAIYELMPLDSHKAFAADGSSPEEDAIWGRMDKESLGQLLGINPALADAVLSSLEPSEARKATLLQSYLNDGAKAPEQAPPETVWYRVKFVKDYDISDVDAGSLSAEPGKESNAAAMEGGYFNSQGRTVDARLKRDSTEPVRFKIGDSYVFDTDTANDLQKNGFANIIGPVYVRPLNDYEFGFRETRRLTTRAQQDLLLVTREFNEAVRTNTVTLEQVRKAEVENQRLKLDQSQYSKEAEVVTNEATELASQVEAKKAELSQIYASIVELHSKIVKRSNELTALINATVPAIP